MEMPIRIMVVLLVTLVVGFAIIQFSKTIITDSRQSLSEINKDPDKIKEHIIELQSTSAAEIAYLAENCLKSEEDREPMRTICFAVYIYGPIGFGANEIITEWKEMGHSEDKIDVTGFNSGSKGIFIYYTRPKVEILS